MRVREWQDVYTQLRTTCVKEIGFPVNAEPADFSKYSRRSIQWLVSHIG